MRERLLRLWAGDAAAFAEDVLGLSLYPYQAKVLRDGSKRVLVCGGRQVGKSLMAAVKSLHHALTHRDSTVLLVAPTHRQSRNLLSMVVRLVESSVVEGSVRRRTGARIELSNGSRILALPSGRWGHGIRGYSADLVILDEAAFIPEEVITRAVLPMLSATDGTCWMLSTPWDRRHFFYRAYTSRAWSVHRVPSSLNPRITRRFLEEQREMIGEERFRAEYLAEFVDDGGSYFPMSLLRRCIGDPRMMRGLTVGYDPGGRESYAAAVGVGESGGRIHAPWHIWERGRSYVWFDLRLLEEHKRLGFRKIIVDETGIGGPILEHLRSLGLPARGEVLTESKRGRILGNLKLLMERGLIVLPDSTDLLTSLNSIEYEATWRGTYRFSHRRGGYDDLAYALALAVWGLRRGGETIVEPLQA